MAEEKSTCGLCGEPMPAGEEMFQYHGYSGPCPKPPKQQPYQSRVREELSQLLERHRKLAEFIKSEQFQQLPAEQKDLMKKQEGVMCEYAFILESRIKLFK